ncbi:MAG: 3-hydroxyanthranilate 3,4-dioxygenase [Gammaproteobacteria bacterium]|nr:3-hydroxyanthranilate 3,4-dioxygenase [Gammaproteobacteria bacterium]
MDTLTPFPLAEWIEENRHLLKPPVGNKQIFENDEFIVMAVGGPNSRKDYHYDEGPELFYQHEGEMLLKTMQGGKPVDIPIRRGEMLLLPGKVPHSPLRYPDSIGIVVERRRQHGEKDGLLWFCERCHEKLYEEYFELHDIETDFPPVFDRFFGNEKRRTCRACGAVMQPPE